MSNELVIYGVDRKSFTLEPQHHGEFVIYVNCSCELFIRISPSSKASKIIIKSMQHRVYIFIKTPYVDCPIYVQGTPILTFGTVQARFVQNNFIPIDDKQYLRFQSRSTKDHKLFQMAIGIFGHMNTNAEIKYVQNKHLMESFSQGPLIYSSKNHHLGIVELWGFPKTFPNSPFVRINSAKCLDVF